MVVLSSTTLSCRLRTETKNVASRYNRFSDPSAAKAPAAKSSESPASTSSAASASFQQGRDQPRQGSATGGLPTREERREHEAGFCENYGEEDAIRGSTVPCYDLTQVLVQVQDEGKQPCAGSDTLSLMLLCLHCLHMACGGAHRRRRTDPYSLPCWPESCWA